MAQIGLWNVIRVMTESLLFLTCEPSLVALCALLHRKLFVGGKILASESLLIDNWASFHLVCLNEQM